jgi:hypothetical protein
VGRRERTLVIPAKRSASRNPGWIPGLLPSGFSDTLLARNDRSGGASTLSCAAQLTAQPMREEWYDCPILRNRSQLKCQDASVFSRSHRVACSLE